MNTVKKRFEFVDGFYSSHATPFQNVDGEDAIEISDLPEHKSSRCWIIETENHIFLQSYNTIVSDYNKNTCNLNEDKYSRTTSRQQTWFRLYLIRRKSFERREEARRLLPA